ncbi:caspase family protein [Nonomuraea ceibae]|uniref:caspase family protein n=1 Tax=Nonomuraea ceibae TaxID=1935170 RepID=UPI001C5E6A99|nr:caspase family protein [Nonomuraea ceibae]
MLIGTSHYTDGRLTQLPAVRQNLGDLAAVFTDPAHGIVSREHCLTLADESDVRRLGGRIRAAASEAEDLFLVYYAGHGLVGSRRHELYLALPDSEWEAPEFTAMEYDKLRGAVLDSPARNKVVILDCCFSGRAVGDLMADPDTAVLGQLDVNGSYVLTSAQGNQVALKLPGEEHTAFSGRLIRLLREGASDGPELLTLDFLYQRLRHTMQAEKLSVPSRRALQSAGLIALAPNRAAGRPIDPIRSPEPFRTTGLRWDVDRSSRGNDEGAYVTFEARHRSYWVLTFLTSLLGLLAVLLAFTAELPTFAKIAFGVGAAVCLALTFGYVQMARAPVRLEIGTRGVQLFARSGTTWIPWSVIGAIDIEQVNGSPHVVVWLEEADIFPDSDIFGGGAQFMPKHGAIALCSISILRARRHEIAKALRGYGGQHVKRRNM